jgi:hypothetical protein
LIAVITEKVVWCGGFRFARERMMYPLLIAPMGCIRRAEGMNLNTAMLLGGITKE